MHVVYEVLFGPDQPIWISDLSNLTVFGLLATLLGALKKRNCTEKRCWRIGIHPVSRTTFHTCHKHSTREVHDRLTADHARKHPEQHELLNAGMTDR